MRARAALLIAGAVVVVVIAVIGGVYLFSGDKAKLAETAAIGPSPALPPPNQTLIPTVDIAPAKGWPEGKVPHGGGGTCGRGFGARTGASPLAL
jgi:hypothetical protein